MSKEYLVIWAIDFDAESPEEAAAKALTMQRDTSPENTAVVFHVAEHGTELCVNATRVLGQVPTVDLAEQKGASPKCTVMAGNPVDGVRLLGVWDSPEDASEYAEVCLRGQDWWVVALEDSE